MTTNWTSLLNTKRNVSTVSNFAVGKMSGRDFYSTFSGTSSGGIVRGLLRDYGVKQARVLARKALSRRSSVK
jgi:hypothetical protein|tara:strand:- start:171 stop:386 length:216 start_codon:yes stop_codon:yes gene_type:complete